MYYFTTNYQCIICMWSAVPLHINISHIFINTISYVRYDTEFWDGSVIFTEFTVILMNWGDIWVLPFLGCIPNDKYSLNNIVKVQKIQQHNPNKLVDLVFHLDLVLVYHQGAVNLDCFSFILFKESGVGYGTEVHCYGLEVDNKIYQKSRWWKNMEDKFWWVNWVFCTIVIIYCEFRCTVS